MTKKFNKKIDFQQILGKVWDPNEGDARSDHDAALIAVYNVRKYIEDKVGPIQRERHVVVPDDLPFKANLSHDNLTFIDVEYVDRAQNDLLSVVLRYNFQYSIGNWISLYGYDDSLAFPSLSADINIESEQKKQVDGLARKVSKIIADKSDERYDGKLPNGV